MRRLHYFALFLTLQLFHSSFSYSSTPIFDQVGFLGRDLDLYYEMFPQDLELKQSFYSDKKILFVPGGPSSVKGEIVRNFGVHPDQVVMVDLAYPNNDLSVEENAEQLEEAIFSPERDLKWFYEIAGKINWNIIDGAATAFGVRDLPERRQRYIDYSQKLETNNENFLNDYRNHSDWMVYGDITNLPEEVTRQQYDYIYSSNLLHLYNNVLDEDFHVKAYEQLLSILAPGGKLMVFPITTMYGRSHDVLDRILNKLDPNIYSVELVKSDSPSTNDYFKKLLKVNYKTAYYLRITKK